MMSMNSKQAHFAMHPSLPEHKYSTLHPTSTLHPSSALHPSSTLHSTSALHSSSEALRRACLQTPQRTRVRVL
ncbi:hypothetical protein NHX12_005519 [Muraenolepis orangiensis]|uniref:Uncharacterized protein n=1 Tax=Muraenolepis orangiensis TaxID=630683 RepID=A0A9Q0DRN8_9TELE|nr:hypothetical protein NHX12_005519 [Muraenolepis orangiensis]